MAAPNVKGTPKRLDVNQRTAGTITVMIGSMCGNGFMVTRPSVYAVSSPCQSAVRACAYSCATRENSRTGSARMKSLRIRFLARVGSGSHQREASGAGIEDRASTSEA